MFQSKLRLDLDSLTVHSFVTQPDNDAARGTVMGYSTPTIIEIAGVVVATVNIGTVVANDVDELKGDEPPFHPADPS